MSWLRGKPESSVRRGGYPDPNAKVFVRIKLAVVLLFCAIGFYTYSNWQAVLDKLDNGPISAFALMGSPTFTSNADIRDSLSEINELKGYFGQDTDILREKIEALPWVKGAIIRKIWPNKLSIWVDEYKPVAVWNESDFLSPDGEIFQLPAGKIKSENYPRLAGPDFQATQVLDAWNQIYADFKQKNLQLKAIKIDDRGAWQVTLDNGVILKLGRGDWKPKLERFVTIYPQIEVPENKKLSYVDLRYPNGAAVGMIDSN